MATRSEPAAARPTLGTDQPTASERAAYRSRIAVIQRSLNSLREEQDLLQGRLDAYTYPVLTLPNEVVSEIFIHFLPPYPKCPPIVGLLSPTLLCQICRKWRDIALSTPALWRAVTLSIRKKYARKEKLRLLESFLTRSISYPFSFRLHCGFNGRSVGSLALPPVIRAINSHCVRWEHLTLYTHLGPLRSIDGPFPVLRSLTIRIWFEEEFEVDSAVTLAFLHAPLLRQVIIQGFDDFYFDILPWSQLTVLTVDAMSPDDCAQILNQALSLVHCNPFLGLFPETQVDYSWSNITLPYLENFMLTFCSPRHAAHILRRSLLDHLTLPALRRLHVMEVLIRPSPLTTLESLITRSRCNLQELFVSNSALSSDLYHNALPSVAWLIIDQAVDVQDRLWGDSDSKGEAESGGETESDGEEELNTDDGQDSPGGQRIAELA
ncbi:hypothetical protein FB451DRAFT_1059562 [Mycena latifolia]|nr:hypothetical protein FB451DRAFT_1059562 [Mycena latifolia]